MVYVIGVVAAVMAMITTLFLWCACALAGKYDEEMDRLMEEKDGESETDSEVEE